jgi:hypothetical protein
LETTKWIERIEEEIKEKLRKEKDIKDEVNERLKCRSLVLQVRGLNTRLTTLFCKRIPWLQSAR